MSSPAASRVRVRVILFGATGNLGSHLARAFISPQYKDLLELTVAVRTTDPSDASKSALLSSLRAGSGHIVRADLDHDDVASLTTVVAGHDVIVSAVWSATSMEQGQLKLIEAAKLGKCKHFIPSDFGADLRHIPNGNPVPLFDISTRIQEVLKSSGLSYTSIAAGCFTEYLLSPFSGVDISAARVAAPVSFDLAITTTTLADVGLLTADIVANYEAPHVKNCDALLLGAQTITYSEITDELEKQFNKKFTRVTVTSEELTSAIQADTTVTNFPARFQFVFANHNKGVNWDINDAYPLKHAPHMQLTRVKEYIAKLT